MHATGPFDVKMAPQQLAQADPTRARFSLDKHYHGALEATAMGEMLSGGDPKAGEAGYVALETVTGTLDGRHGTFQLMHWGTMHAGGFELRVEVVHGSATGDLKGLTGRMQIKIEGGTHNYVFDYSLPEAR